jgi:acyl-CoA reductase-like NAD-dependent aldehyde dehydrogenase
MTGVTWSVKGCTEIYNFPLAAPDLRPRRELETSSRTAIDSVTAATAHCTFVRKPDNKDGDMNIETVTFRPGRLSIGGTWSDGATGARRDVVDPADGRVLTTVVEADATDVDAAVTSARTAFERGPWPRTPARDRARVLRRTADLIRERADELALIESHDVGKPITLATVVDVETAAQQYEYCASLAERLDGATRSTPIPALAYTFREPVGVVAAITPFNFPLVLSSTKIAAALAAGNVVVHKPADDTPLSALFMAQLLADAGLPDGVLNVVTGSGQVVGEALLRHPGVDKIAFTGSTAVGRHAASVAGEHLKPVTMELGGNAAHLVFDDADLDVAIGAVIKAFVFNSGQFCMAGPRLLVVRPLHDTVVGILEQAVPTVPIGNPRDEATVIGPMAGERQLHKVEEYVELARKEGGRIVCGGEPLDLDGGFYFKPTVIADLPADSRVIAEEVFGPVLTVQAFDTEDEAVELANGTPYGLAAGLQTRDVARAHRVAARLDAGIVWVNDWGMLDPAVPFGGVKDSGFGREYGPEALDAYTRVKSVVVSLPQPE